MFYSHFILAKKGPLGTIWIAAHLEGKLRKNQVTDTNITDSIDSILFPEVPIALRLSGHLLLGVVKIYSRKVNYLFNDCSDALVKIKQAFHASAVNLPPEATTAPFSSITLPETYDFEKLDNYFKYDNSFHTQFSDFNDQHVTERDLITLQDQTQDAVQNPSVYMLDERFPRGSDPYSLLFESDMDHGKRGSDKDGSLLQDNQGSALEEDVLPPLPVDDRMDIENDNNLDQLQDIGTPGIDATPSMHFMASDDEIDMADSIGHNMQNVPDIERLRAAPEHMAPEPLFMDFEDEELPNNRSNSKNHLINPIVDNDIQMRDVEATPVLDETPLLRRSTRLSLSSGRSLADYSGQGDVLGDILGVRSPAFKIGSSPLEPVIPAQKKRVRRKRKVMDQNPVISSGAMKKQLKDTSDICRKRKKNPFTESQVWMLQGTYHDKTFSSPCLNGLTSHLMDLYNDIVKRPSKKPMLKLFTPKEANQSKNDNVELQSKQSKNNHVDVSATPVTNLSFGDESPGDAEFPSFDYELQDFTPGSETPFKMAEPQRSEQEDTTEVFQRPDSEQRVSNDSEHELVSQETRGRTPASVGPDTRKESDVTVPETVNAGVISKDSPRLEFLEDIPDNGALLAADEVEVDGNDDQFFNDVDVSFHKKTTLNRNGMSIRTKAVAHYLKTVFVRIEKEATPRAQAPVKLSTPAAQSATPSTPAPQQPPAPKITLDDLLKGRTRKEAARLYFETLVLKSKDYVDVEQNTGFGEIKLCPTQLLMKDDI